MFQMFHPFLGIYCIQMFFLLQVFYAVWLGASRLGARRAGGQGHWRWWTVVLRQGRARSVLVLSCSSQLLSVARTKRERTRPGATDGHRDKAKCARGMGRRCTGASCVNVARIHPVLAMPIIQRLYCRVKRGTAFSRSNPNQRRKSDEHES